MKGGQPMDPNESPKQINISIQNEVMLVSNSSDQLEKALLMGIMLKYLFRVLIHGNPKILLLILKPGSWVKRN